MWYNGFNKVQALSPVVDIGGVELLVSNGIGLVDNIYYAVLSVLVYHMVQNVEGLLRCQDSE